MSIGARAILMVVLWGVAFMTRAWANCEAGAYTIHTSASYKATSRDEIVLLYQVLPEGAIAARLNAIDGPEVMGFDRESAPVDLRHGAASCMPDQPWTRNPKHDPDDPASEPPFRLSFGPCANMALTLPQSGYLLYDAVSRNVRFPQELFARESLSAPPEVIKEAVQKDLEIREFHALTTPSWGTHQSESQRGRIPAAMMESKSWRLTEIGEALNQFAMVTVVFQIKEPASLFPPELLPENFKKEAPSHLDYPVIYFVPPRSREPIFIGDGSACSTTRLSDSENGAAFDRFSVSKAFDFDADGVVDVLEINKTFAYRLLRDRAPQVIHYGQGC
jgi:hypothetical protein